MRILAFLAWFLLACEDRVHDSSNTSKRPEAPLDQNLEFVPDQVYNPRAADHEHALSLKAISRDDSGLNGPIVATDMQFIANRFEFLISDHFGSIYHYRLDFDKVTQLGNFKLPEVYQNAELGLNALSVHPAFEDNRFIFVAYAVEPGWFRISRLTFDENDYESIPGSEVVVLEVRSDIRDLPPIHSLGSLVFDSNADLIVSIGDHGLSNNSQDLSQNNFFGKLLLITPSLEVNAGGYQVSAKSPTPYSPVLATGLRNPWKGSFDLEGNYWFGDVGNQRFEEVNRLPMNSSVIKNYGWPFWEGLCLVNCDGFVQPVLTYSRIPNEPFMLQDPTTFPSPARSVWVGGAYQPRSEDRYKGLLVNRVIYGDLYTGWIRGISLDYNNGFQGDIPLSNSNLISSWQRGPDDYLYALRLEESDIYRIELNQAGVDLLYSRGFLK